MLKIHNKYGDITCDALENDLEIDLKYGNLYLSRVNGDSDINLAYGNVTAESLLDVDGTVSYANKFRITKLKNANLETKYSKIYIDEAEDLDLESKYDEFNLGTVGNIENEGKYDEVVKDLSVENINDAKFFKNAATYPS